MKIGILIYSHSGNTLSVAEKIKVEMEKRNSDATIEKIALINDDPQSPHPAELKNIPDIDGYDKLIIGAPINGFSLCKAMKMYLQNHAKLKNKEINCFVTQHFKHSFLGGNRGIKQITSFCNNQNSTVKNTAFIHWSSNNRKEEIDTTVDLMADI